VYLMGWRCLELATLLYAVIRLAAVGCPQFAVVAVIGYYACHIKLSTQGGCGTLALQVRHRAAAGVQRGLLKVI
jgi:hypothetical protein